MNPITEPIKEKLVKAGLQMIQDTLVIGTWGNISIRVPNTDSFAITPSGVNYSDITTNDIVILSCDGEILEGDKIPSIEWPLHAAVYKAREDISALMHTHSPYASALSAARKPIPPAVEDVIQIVGGEVSVTKYALPGTKELGEATVEALGDKNAVLLANHGLLGAAKTVEEAFKICKIVEKGAQITLLAQNVGGVVPLSKEECDIMRDFYLNHYGQKK
ncbi:class II aldolase/adducin family protein [bacterium]|nr:class II aldolase/adducin family protein [bacterium]